MDCLVVLPKFPCYAVHMYSVLYAIDAGIMPFGPLARAYIPSTLNHLNQQS